MHCDNGFQAHGETRLIGADIGGSLIFNEATLANRSRIALAADSLTVRQYMVCYEGFHTEGEVFLRDARLGALVDSVETWPWPLWLDGLTYDRLAARPEVTVNQRIEWLRRNDPARYIPQPYDQLATAYRRAGKPEAAREVLIAKQRARRRALPVHGKLLNDLLRWSVGYGYQTWKAVIWLLVLVGLGWVVFDLLHPAQIIAAKPLRERPQFHGALYALDLLLPVGDLNYQGAWIARGWARLFWLVWIVLGWVLTTVVIASLTGISKRD
jgi:hypothetical protein